MKMKWITTKIRFFCGPCATFPRIFVKSGRVDFAYILLANKLTTVKNELLGGGSDALFNTELSLLLVIACKLAIMNSGIKFAVA